VRCLSPQRLSQICVRGKQNKKGPVQFAARGRVYKGLLQDGAAPARG